MKKLKINHIFASDIKKSMRTLTQCEVLKDEHEIRVTVIGRRERGMDDWQGIEFKWYDQGWCLDQENLSKGRWKRALAQLWASLCLVAFSWRNGGVYHFHQHITLLPAWFFAFFGRGALVYDVHDMVLHDKFTDYYSDRLNRCRRLVERMVVARSCSVLSVSDKMREVYELVYPRANHYTIYSIPPFETTTWEKLDQKTIDLAYWGNIAQDRIPFELIEKIQEDGELSLGLHGKIEAHNTADFSGETHYLKNLEGNVRYHGEFIPSEVNGFLEKYKIACFSFRSDRMNIACAMPNKLWQAISNGLPIIVFDGESLQKFVVEHRIGLVVEWGDSMEETLLRLKNAVREIKDNYSTYLESLKKVRVDQMGREAYAQALLETYL